MTNYFKKVQYVHDCIIEKNQENKDYNTLKSLHPKDLKNEMFKTKFVIYENYICNVEEFINSHPGGNLLIESNLYSDVGRYLTGTQDYSKNIKSHSHNFSTHKNLINSLSYAELYENHQLVLRNESYWSSDFGISVYLNEDCVKLNSRNLIADNIFEYKFNIRNYIFAELLPGVDWIGRHFSISSTNLNKTRYYSLCLNLDENLQKKHRLLYKNLKSLEKKDGICNIMEKKNTVKNCLSLYIKKYNDINALSCHISNIIEKDENDLIIRGPNVISKLIFRVSD
jgi:hypothetical protein